MNVAVFGLGKLGLPLAVLLGQKHRVWCVDTSPDLMAALRRRETGSTEPEVADLLKTAELATAPGADAVVKTDLAIILVPTPSDPDSGAFINDFVLSAARDIGVGLIKRPDGARRYTVVVTSTVMPGSCRGPIRETLEQVSGLEVGVDFDLLYSPEFVALGEVIKGMRSPAALLVGACYVGGVGPYTTLMQSVTINHPRVYVVTWEEAELAKLLLNCYLSVKIAFANMVAQYAAGLACSAIDILAFLGDDPRIGPKFLSPGLPAGGPCLPRDLCAAEALAERLDGYLRPSLLSATRAAGKETIEHIARHIVDKVGTDSTIGVLGMAYKPGVPWTMDSAAVDLTTALLERGVVVYSYDPQAGGPWLMAPDDVLKADALVIATPWPEFKALLEERESDTPIFDLWGLLDPDKVSCPLYQFGGASWKSRSPPSPA